MGKHKDPDYKKKWYEANKERLKQKAKKYYQKNKERIKAKTAKWAKDNRERHNELGRKWRQQNLEKSREISRRKNKEWRINNPEKAKEANKRSKEKRKDAIREYNRKYYQEHRHQSIQRVQEWYQKNKEYVLNRSRIRGEKYRNENRDLIRKRGREQYLKRRPVKRAYDKEYYLKNKEKLKLNAKIRYYNNPAHYAISNRIFRFKTLGIKLIPSELISFITKRNNRCEICSKYVFGKDLCVDHKEQQLRGILCSSCNFALGLFKDSIANILNAIRYLDQFSPSSELVCKKPHKRHGLRCPVFKKYILENKIYCCQICKRKDKIYLDHCHHTNSVRGFLCQCCNSAIGGFKDNRELLLSAITYLKRTNIK